MKVIIALALFICLGQSRPQQQQQRQANSRDAVILRYENEDTGLGSYRFAYETSDGQSRTEQGQLKNPGTENEALSVTGSFSFVGPDGVLYTVTYIADENGFQPEGDHLPTSKLGLPAHALASLAGG